MDYAEVCTLTFILGVVALLVLLILLLKPRRKLQKESLLMRLSEWFYILIALGTVSIIIACLIYTWL